MQHLSNNITLLKRRSRCAHPIKNSSGEQQVIFDLLA